MMSDDIDQAFYKLAIKERDYERVRSNRIEQERNAARELAKSLAERLCWYIRIAGATTGLDDDLIETALGRTRHEYVEERRENDRRAMEKLKHG